MKKILILYVVIITLLLSAGCGENASNIEENDDLKLENIENGDQSDQEVTAEEEFINFRQKENWKIAYDYMLMMGKPVKDVAGNYLDWKFLDSNEGSAVYEDSVSGMRYEFLMTDAIYNYYGRKLASDEIVQGIETKMGVLFPNAVWPTNSSETEVYLDAYLGVDFDVVEAYPGDVWYVYSFSSERNTFDNMRFGISIWVQPNIITSETGIQIVGEDTTHPEAD